ncbi:MAG: hypothetical protein LKE54_07410 [Prevotella sp.]|jgi:hypothetical protein|nr:hypothetical protein [Prevotella sp.]MCH3994861.1 hypothetical protein [Prevotella sp.]
MDILFKAKLTPSPELTNMIKQLSDIGNNKMIQKTLRLAARYLVNQGKARLRAGERPEIKHTGNLLKSMVVKVKKNNLGALAGFRQGSSGGQTYNGYHSWLVDQGTGPRKTLKGYYRGKSGHGVQGPAGSLLFWTTTKKDDTPEAMLMIETGIRQAFNQIMGANSIL